jgi:hypothetical protein
LYFNRHLYFTLLSFFVVNIIMSTPSSFENALADYRARLSNVKAEEVADQAKRIAEADEPLEELKQVVGEVTTPLALDFLKEGIMHRMGVASAQTIGGKAELKSAINKLVNKRLGALRDRASGAVEDAVSSARRTITSSAQDGLAQARSAIDAGAQRASDAVSEGTQRASQAVNDAGGQADDDVQAVRDDAETARRNFRAPEDEDSPFPINDRINALGDVDDPDLVTSGANQINSDLNARFNEAFPADDPDRDTALNNFRTSFREEYDGPNPNLVLRSQAGPGGLAEEGNADDAMDFLNYKSDMYNDAIARKTAGVRQPDGYDADGQPTFEAETEGVSGPAPTTIGADPDSGVVATRVAQAEREGATLAPDQQLPTPQAQGPTPRATPDEAGTPSNPAPAPDDDLGPGGTPPTGDDAPPAPSGAGAGVEGAEVGAEEGLEDALLASAPETGGLGAILGGLVGIGTALASIFGGGQKKPPPPVPQPKLSMAVQSLGLR